MKSKIFWLLIITMLCLGGYNFVSSINEDGNGSTRIEEAEIKTEEAKPEDLPVDQLTSNLVGTWNASERYAFSDYVQEIEGQMSYYSNGSFDKKVTYALYESDKKGELIEMSDEVKRNNRVMVSGVRIKGKWTPNDNGMSWNETVLTCSEEVSYTSDRARSNLLACDLYTPRVGRQYGIYDTEFGESKSGFRRKDFLTFSLEDVRYKDYNYSNYRRLEFDASKEFDPEELETKIAKEKQEREAEIRRRQPKKTGNPLIDAAREKIGNPILDGNRKTGNLLLDNNETKLQLDKREFKLELSPLESLPSRSLEEKNRLILENTRERNRRMMEFAKKKNGG